MFSISFRKQHDKTGKQLVENFDHQNVKLRQQLMLVLCFCRVIETRFLIDQHAYFLRAAF